MKVRTSVKPFVKCKIINARAGYGIAKPRISRNKVRRNAVKMITTLDGNFHLCGCCKLTLVGGKRISALIEEVEMARIAGMDLLAKSELRLG